MRFLGINTFFLEIFLSLPLGDLFFSKKTPQVIGQYTDTTTNRRVEDNFIYMQIRWADERRTSYVSFYVLE